MIPGDRLSVRRLVGILITYARIATLVSHEGGVGASLVGDALVITSGRLLAERTIYLASAAVAAGIGLTSR